MPTTFIVYYIYYKMSNIFCMLKQVSHLRINARSFMPKGKVDKIVVKFISISQSYLVLSILSGLAKSRDQEVAPTEEG